MKCAVRGEARCSMSCFTSEKEDTKNDLSKEIRSQPIIDLNLPIAHMQVCAVPESSMMQDRCMSRTHNIEMWDVSSAHAAFLHHACSEVDKTILHKILAC